VTDEQVMGANLLPCPFCGLACEIERTECRGSRFYSIGCDTRYCPGRSPPVAYELAQMAEVIAGWNRRVPAAKAGDA